MKRRLILGRPAYRTQAGVWMAWGRIEGQSRSDFVTVPLGLDDPHQCA